MATKIDPFAELDPTPVRITPRRLKGEQKELWDKLAERFGDGTYAGVPMQALYTWGQRHLGLTCSISCFRGQLLQAASVHGNGSVAAHA